MSFHFSRRGLLGALVAGLFGWLARKAEAAAPAGPPPAGPPPAPAAGAAACAPLARVTTYTYDCGARPAPAAGLGVTTCVYDARAWPGPPGGGPPARA